MASLAGVTTASSQGLNSVAFDRWLDLAVAVGGSNIVFSTAQSAYLTWTNMNYSTLRSNVPKSQLNLYSVTIVSAGEKFTHTYIHT